jgi:hypothetical protein
MIELDDLFCDTNMRFIWRIEEFEVKETLKRMKICKTVKPDDISIEVWRRLRDVAIVWFTKLFKNIFDPTRSLMIERSILGQIFKNKEDIWSCTNYRRIKFMSHTMKF